MFRFLSLSCGVELCGDWMRGAANQKRIVGLPWGWRSRPPDGVPGQGREPEIQTRQFHSTAARRKKCHELNGNETHSNHTANVTVQLWL